MRWKKLHLPDLPLACAYCGREGKFPHAMSYEHYGETLSLYKCPGCASLIYDLADVAAPPPPVTDLVTEETWTNARYVIEAGFSARYVTMCALAALPDLPTEQLQSYTFVDVGAGFGMASYLVKTLFGMPTVTVEPSFMGKISSEILGLDVHRAYFEKLPPALLNELASKSCCMHLNSVVEHLADPFAALKPIVGRVKVETLAIVVPDAAFLSYETPFIVALPFLSPRDHRHLPSRAGVERLLRRLNFEHVHVHAEPGLLTAVGSRSASVFPSPRTVELAEQVLLSNLLRHPNPHVVEGGVSRLLPGAVATFNAPLLAALRRRAPYEDEAALWLKRIAEGAWSEAPLHLGPTCFWLAWDAIRNGRVDGALSLLTITQRFGEVFAEAHPDLAMTAMLFKWEALLLKAEILSGQQNTDAALAALADVIASRSDAMAGADGPTVERAKAAYTRIAKADLAAAKTLGSPPSADEIWVDAPEPLSPMRGATPVAAAQRVDAAAPLSRQYH